MSCVAPPCSEKIGIEKKRMLVVLLCRTVPQVRTGLKTPEIPEIHAEIFEEGYTSAVPFVLVGIGCRPATQASELTGKLCTVCSYNPVIFIHG